MKRLLCLLLLSLALTVPAIAGSQKMVLQAQPSVSAAAADICDTFYVCSYWHEEYPVYCTIWHVIYCGPAIEQSVVPGTGDLDRGNEIERAFVGRKLVVENRSEVRRIKIQRVVPQYHLTSGAVVEPRGAWDSRDAVGEDWGDVRSRTRRSLQVANWEDRDRNGIVGVGDRVVFSNGTESAIKAVRLGVHVDVLGTTPKQ